MALSGEGGKGGRGAGGRGGGGGGVGLQGRGRSSSKGGGASKTGGGASARSGGASSGGRASAATTARRKAGGGSASGGDGDGGGGGGGGGIGLLGAAAKLMGTKSVAGAWKRKARMKAVAGGSHAVPRFGNGGANYLVNMTDRLYADKGEFQQFVTPLASERSQAGRGHLFVHAQHVFTGRNKSSLRLTRVILHQRWNDKNRRN